MYIVPPPPKKKKTKQNITKKDNTLVYFELGRFPLYIKRKFCENTFVIHVQPKPTDLKT